MACIHVASIVTSPFPSLTHFLTPSLPHSLTPRYSVYCELQAAMNGKGMHLHVYTCIVSGIIVVVLSLSFSFLPLQESEQGSERPGGQAVAHYQHLHAPQNTRVQQETGLKATRKTKGCYICILIYVHVYTYKCVYMEIQCRAH